MFVRHDCSAMLARRPPLESEEQRASVTATNCPCRRVLKAAPKFRDRPFETCLPLARYEIAQAFETGSRGLGASDCLATYIYRKMLENPGTVSMSDPSFRASKAYPNLLQRHGACAVKLHAGCQMHRLLIWSKSSRSPASLAGFSHRSGSYYAVGSRKCGELALGGCGLFSSSGWRRRHCLVAVYLRC